ncbi:Dicer, partial [Globisporangium splendens]
MSALHEHQQEVVAVARQQNVLLVAPQRIGKTYTASHVLREHLLMTAATSARRTAFAVAIAASESERASLYQELARVCGIPILWCDAVDEARRADSVETKPFLQVSGGKANAAAKRWETDMVWVQQQLTACLEQCQCGILVVSPKIVQILLRKQLLSMTRVSVLVIEETEHVHTTSPSFYSMLVDHLTTLDEGARPRIFATTRVPASKLNLGGVNRHALYAHIHVLTVAPVLNPAIVTAPPLFPPLLCEPFDPKVAAADDGGEPLSSSPPRYEIAVGMRDFLFGENDKKIDFIRVFRMELEMGNSAAVYDEKKRQDKVNQFIQDADSVYQHLGYWCLLKFIELELQANLKACLVDDDQNVNHRKKRQQETTRSAKTGGINDDENEEGEVDEGEDMQSNEDESGGAQSDLLAELIASKMDLDETTQQKVRPILKLISWLDAQTKKLGVRHATPRLIKTAEVVRSRLHNGGHDKRAWVFLQRRAHCRVVADYLTVCLADIGLPPCCCMLGNSHARVSGSLHFSSFLKVVTMFAQCKTNVMVTTSIAKKSQKQRMEPPLCDLVVVMDELLEANKLFEFGKRAHPVTGVVKYVTPNTPSDFKKFDALVKKMHEFVQMEEEQQRAQQMQNQNAMAGNGAAMSGAMSDAGDNAAANINAQSQNNMLPGRLQVVPREVTPANPNEIVNRDTGAVLNLANSVACLSKFCDTLPGLDTYDQRPQYTVKRHPVSSGMSLAAKQYKKKKLKYNSKLYDKIDDCRADADAKATKDSTADDDNRFQFAAELKLPMSLGIKKKLASHKVSTVAEAKGIVAFKACQELIKKGLLDRHFRSKLIEDQTATIHGSDKDDVHDAATGVKRADGDADDTTIIDADDHSSQNRKLADLSTQNSYDLPPVSAAELSLIPIRSLLRGETNDLSSSPTSVESESVTMCFYGLTGVRFAILATKPLYTGNTNTGWRYDFATSDVMEPVLRPVTLAKEPTKVTLTKPELQQALHFHLVTMRLACMEVQDAMRDIDIAGENVWKEFSEQNDKGYLVAPSLFDATTKTFSIDWEYLRDIIEKPLIQPIWPFPEITEECPQEEWICVPTYRRNVTYVVKGLSETQTVADMKVAFADKEAWNKHAKAGKSAQGNPILGRWHTQDQILGAEDDQPLLYCIQTPPIVPIIRRVMQRNNSEGSIAQSSTKFNERLLIPQYTSLLRLTKTRYFEAIGIVPVLYEFERKCQMSNLMEKIGLELDISLLDDATSKPAYERLEILGDTYLKLETSWFMYENRKDITQEGDLTRLRRDIIRNDRLNTFALTARLHHYILYPAQIEQHPFEFWKPSCMGKTPKPVVAPSKWIADVLEAICGAYLLGQGEKGARYFLKWIGVSVLEEPFMFARPFYPDCFPCELYDDDVMDSNGADALNLNFSIARFEDLPQRLVLLQQRLKYTFKNKRLLLEAVTHPTAGHLVLLMDANAQNTNISSSSSKKSSATSKEKMVWKGDYERLEYFGDAIIEYLTLSYAFLAHDKWLPGSLSQWKSATISNDALGKTALACFGVDECICAGAVRMDRETMQIVDRIERKYPRSRNPMNSSRSNLTGTSAPLQSKKKKPKLTGTNPMSLPKMFADVFEALVAAVFLDSGKDLQKTRDVFLGPLLDTVGKDAFAYVCHESGLTIDHGNGDNGGDDQDAIMESLFSDDDDGERSTPGDTFVFDCAAKLQETDMSALHGAYLLALNKTHDPVRVLPGFSRNSRNDRSQRPSPSVLPAFCSDKTILSPRASTMLRISIRDKLFLFTAISGALFVYVLSQRPVLEFHELSKLLPAMSSSSFKDQTGFLNALRWLENLHTPQDLEMIIQMVMKSPAVANEAIEPSDEQSKFPRNASSSTSYFGFASNSNSVAPSLLMRLTDIIACEMYVRCSKMLLQCGLVLFLYQLKTMSRRRAMTTMSLCMLVLICWRMTQSCLQEMFSLRRTSTAAGQSDKPKKHDEAIALKAAFLSTLFLLRYAGMAIVNFVIGRAYQVHFCEPWPETWKRIPQYISSKNLIVSTFYFASSCVAFMCFTCTALRSLSEAALHFESLALACSLVHAVYYRLAREKQKGS